MPVHKDLMRSELDTLSGRATDMVQKHRAEIADEAWNH